MTQHTLFVCVLCRFSSIEQQQAGLSAGQSLFNQLSEGLASCKGFAIIQPEQVQSKNDSTCFQGACDRSAT